MTIESFQDTLFEDPIGLRFRHAREKSKLTLELVGQQLKLPVAVLDAIEREDWARLGAPIFVRSYVGSYAKLLGLPASLADEVVRGKPVPQLLAVGNSLPTRGTFDRGVMNLVYLAMTIAIVCSVVALAMYFQGPRRNAEVLPLDAPSSYSSTATQPTSLEPGASTGEQSDLVGVAPGSSDSSPDAAGGLAAQLPVMASLAPSLSTAGDEMVLRFSRQSWVDLVDASGRHVERGLMAAGSERRFAAGQLAKATLGDASGVQVTVGGAALDLTPFRDANVARFTVSSRGVVAPMASD